MSNEQFQPNAIIGGRLVQGGNPSDGDTLVYNDATKLWEFTTGGASLNELEFLASKSVVGKLVNLQGVVTSDTDIVSYTPAVGVTFTLYKVAIQFYGTAADQFNVVIKNDVTNRDYMPLSAVNTETYNYTSPLKGDTLLGDGIKKYRVLTSGVLGTTNVSAVMVGYID